MVNFSLNTFDVLRDLGLFGLYVLPLVLTQTWLLGLDFRLRWTWVGLQLLSLFVCLGLVPLGFGLCLATLFGLPLLLPLAALVVAFLLACFRVWERTVPWFAQQAFQGRIPNLKERLGLSLLVSAAGWWFFPLISRFFPLGFKLGLLVVVGVAVGQLTGRFLRR